MAASFPSSPKSFTTKVDFSTTVLAEHVNSLQEEVVAVESHLVGTGGSMLVSSGWVGTFDQTTGTGGSYPNWSSLRARLNNIEYGIQKALTSGGGAAKQDIFLLMGA